MTTAQMLGRSLWVAACVAVWSCCWMAAAPRGKHGVGMEGEGLNTVEEVGRESNKKRITYTFQKRKEPPKEKRPHKHTHTHTHTHTQILEVKRFRSHVIVFKRVCLRVHVCEY